MSQGHTRRRLLTGASAVTLAGLAGCIATSRDVEEPIQEHYDVEELSAVTASAVDGDVTVTGENRDDIALTGIKAAASEGDLESVRLDTSREDGTLALEVDVDGGFLRLGPDPKMDLEVAVPAGLQVSRVETTSGDLEVTDVAGETTADTTNGDVTIDAVDGPFTVETTNGDVAANGVEGDATVETTNGAVDLSISPDLEATLDASTTNGEIVVEGFDEDTIRTGSGLEATRGDGRHDLEVSTTNGDIDVRVEKTGGRVDDSVFLHSAP